MNIKEAFTILGFTESSGKAATVEEIKAKYKTLAKTKHPDIDKTEGATERFQRINEAYQTAQDFKSGKYQEDQNPFMQGGGFADIFNNFGFGNHSPNAHRRAHQPPPSIELTVDFKESVLGCTRPIQFTRTIKCDPCNGIGYTVGRNSCTKCDGFGHISYQKGNMHIQSMCSSCFGKNTTKTSCSICNSTGGINNEVSLSINVPIGVKNGDILQLRGAGHFVQSSMFGDEYSNASLKINVIPTENMSILNNDVISILDISLLEALTGTEKIMNTVYEENKTIKVPPASKNKDEININNHGLKNTNGAHKFIININYPENLQPLIDTLKKEN